jgi:transposase InsO family protein
VAGRTGRDISFGCVSQYTSIEYGLPFVGLYIRSSMSWVGQRWDNALAESYFWGIENELIHRTAFPRLQDAR